MTEEYQQVRDDLDIDIFAPYGKSVTFIKKSHPTYNTRGELESETETSSTQIIVPYNIGFKVQSHQAFGNLNEGEMDAACRYDLDVAIDDVFVLETERFKVKRIERNYLPENVVTIIRLTKEA